MSGVDVRNLKRVRVSRWHIGSKGLEMRRLVSYSTVYDFGQIVYQKQPQVSPSGTQKHILDCSCVCKLSNQFQPTNQPTDQQTKQKQKQKTPTGFLNDLQKHSFTDGHEDNGSCNN